MTTKSLTIAVRVMLLNNRLAVLISDEVGNAKEIQHIATELYDCAKELRYQARQRGLADVEHYALKAMDFSDAVLSV